MNASNRVIPVVPAAGCDVPVQVTGAPDVDIRPAFVRELHGLGVRATVTRLRILELLHCESGRWVRAEEVYQALLGQQGGEALPSIYRNLKDLERAGLLLRTWEEGRRSAHAVYQLRSEWVTNGAIVLVCEGCQARFALVDPVMSEAWRLARQEVSGASAPSGAARIACIDRHVCARRARAIHGALSRTSVGKA